MTCYCFSMYSGYYGMLDGGNLQKQKKKRAKSPEHNYFMNVPLRKID